MIASRLVCYSPLLFHCPRSTFLSLSLRPPTTRRRQEPVGRFTSRSGQTRERRERDADGSGGERPQGDPVTPCFRLNPPIVGLSPTALMSDRREWMRERRERRTTKGANDRRNRMTVNEPGEWWPRDQREWGKSERRVVILSLRLSLLVPFRLSLIAGGGTPNRRRGGPRRQEKRKRRGRSRDKASHGPLSLSFLTHYAAQRLRTRRGRSRSPKERENRVAARSRFPWPRWGNGRDRGWWWWCDRRL